MCISSTVEDSPSYAFQYSPSFNLRSDSPPLTSPIIDFPPLFFLRSFPRKKESLYTDVQYRKLLLIVQYVP
jgi:hypothetical protein